MHSGTVGNSKVAKLSLSDVDPNNKVKKYSDSQEVSVLSPVKAPAADKVSNKDFYDDGSMFENIDQN